MQNFDKEHSGEGFHPTSGKPVSTSAGKLWGWNTIYGKDGDHDQPYMTRAWIGRLRLHIFHRGDQDPDCHDHPWDFWTFPFVPYIEEVLVKRRETFIPGGTPPEARYDLVRVAVPAGRWTYRAATHTHRVLSRAEVVYSTKDLGPTVVLNHAVRRAYNPCAGPIVTVVWRSKPKRAWGFLKNRDGKWCWVGWKTYVFGGGKNAPCGDE